MDITRLEQALRAADAAGDIEGATQLAQALRAAMRPSLAQSNPAEYDPTSAAYQERYGTTSGNSFLENARIGAGKFFTDIGLGAQQIGASIADAVAPRERNLSSLVTGAPKSRADEMKEKAAQKRQTDANILKTGGGWTGYIGAAVPAGFLPGVNSYTGTAVMGGALGGLQPTVGDESRLFNTALGAGGSVALKGLSNGIASLFKQPAATTVKVTPGNAGAQASATVTPTASASGGGASFGTVGDDISSGLTAAQRRAMEVGREMGMRTTPGQATGSRALQQLEAKLESQPMTSGPFNAVRANNQSVLNSAAAKAIGEVGDSVDSSVLSAANERIGKAFQRVADSRPRTIDSNAFLGKLSGIESDFEGLLPNGQGILDNSLVKQLFAFAGKGNATGEQIQNISSKLGKAAYNNLTSANGDRQLGMALYQVKDVADDLLAQGLSESESAALTAARQQYRNLMLLTQRVGVVNPSTGNVNGVSLANLLQQKDKAGFLLGRNDTALYNAARFAQAFKPIVGDSGTATRSMIQGPTDFLLSLPTTLATRAYVSSPSVAVAQGAQAAGRAVSPAVSPITNLLPYIAPQAGGLLAPNLGR